MSISAQKQEQALLDLELYLAQPAPKPRPILPPPPPPPLPISAQKPAIFNTGESKKRYGEAVTQDEKESEKRLKVTQVAQVTPVAPVTPVVQVASVALVTQVAPNVPEKHSNCIFTIFFSNNKNMIQIPSVKITKEIENKFLYFLRDCISVLNDGKISLNKVFDKAFNKAITFLNFIINMNIKPMVLTIGTNDGIVTDTRCLHITFDFLGSIDTLFLYRHLKMTNIDTFDKQVISDIKNTIAHNAGIFAKNIQSLANFTEADAIKAKHDLNTAQENIKKAESDFNTAQENITKAKSELKTAQNNVITTNVITTNVIRAHQNVITAFENANMAHQKLAAAQKNVTTAQQKLSTAQADATLTKEKAINADKNATKKTKDARDAEMITKDKEKINLPKPERWVIFKHI